MIHHRHLEAQHVPFSNDCDLAEVNLVPCNPLAFFFHVVASDEHVER